MAMDAEKELKVLKAKIKNAYLYAKTDSTKAVLEDILSEFKESEDERTRKNIIKAFKIFEDKQAWVGHCLDDIDWDACIAWLEKQCEHANFINKIQVGDKVTRNQDGVLVNLSQLERVAKPVEEYNITGIGSKNAQGKLGEMIKNLKPAWSDEDEKFFKTALWHISYSVSNGKSTDVHCATTDWLKSLKERYTWKPSGEQLDAIKDAMDYLDCSTKKVREYLMSLYEDLKKLKG